MALFAFQFMLIPYTTLAVHIRLSRPLACLLSFLFFPLLASAQYLSPQQFSDLGLFGPPKPFSWYLSHNFSALIGCTFIGVLIGIFFSHALRPIRRYIWWGLAALLTLALLCSRIRAFGRWLRLLVQQAITVNARNINVQPHKPVLFLLDEMAALGHLTMVEQAYGLMAGFGMQLWGIVQDLSQLEQIYGKGWETFIGNSGVLQYFGSRDHKTADYFSKLCGVTTVLKFSFGNAIARAIGYSGNASSSTTTHTNSSNYDVVQRQLAFPDELMVMRDNAALVMVEQFNPIRARKLEWFKNDQIKHLGVNLHQPQIAGRT